MLHAFKLARRGPRGGNPQVGAVVLAVDGRAGEGWHQGCGTAHAEVAAIAALRAAGGDSRGATMVVSLEPCNHTGRTDPCSQALIAAGISRVVYAVDDPHPVAAGGADYLRQAGVQVVAGVEVAAGRALIADWLAEHEPAKVRVTLKIAQSIDALVAAADGTSRWITGAAARRHAHRIRAEVSAIIVGTGTIWADNPSLTARLADGSLAPTQPERIVVGHRGVPEEAAVRGPGGALVQLATHDPGDVVAALAERGHRHVLVEGGPRLATAFLAAGLVDELHCYLAPVFLGQGTSSVADIGVPTLAQAPRWQITQTCYLHPDVLIIAHPKKEKTCSPE